MISAAEFVEGKKFKAVQTGGPLSGRMYTEHLLDTPVDFDKPFKSRLDDGLRRHGCYGRRQLYGGRCKILSFLLPVRIMREMSSLQDRHIPEVQII